MRLPGGPSGRHHGFCTCFPKRTCCVPGAAVNGAKFVRDLYQKSGDTFGKYTVPILWDKKKASRCWWLGVTVWGWCGQDALHRVLLLHVRLQHLEYHCQLAAWSPLLSHPLPPAAGLRPSLQGCIVNNESSEILRMFNAEFNDLAGNPGLDL